MQDVKALQCFDSTLRILWRSDVLVALALLRSSEATATSARQGRIARPRQPGMLLWQFRIAKLDGASMELLFGSTKLLFTLEQPRKALTTHNATQVGMRRLVKRLIGSCACHLAAPVWHRRVQTWAYSGIMY